jgi:hemerythrin-like domain-containing protein
MSADTFRRLSPRLLVPAIAATLLAGLLWARTRRVKAHEEREPADVGFMRAMHDALRRDMARLRTVAPWLEGSQDGMPHVREGWDEFRTELQRHHAAEDDDLWPVLRQHVTLEHDHREIDAMVDEHRKLEPAIAAVDTALANGTGITPAVDELDEVLVRHLDHEERTIFPLLEQHLSRREWRTFLVTERRRTPLRHRPEFLTWVLDDANDSDSAAVLAELPPPGRLVYRRVLAPRYAAKHRWETDMPAMVRAS